VPGPATSLAAKPTRKNNGPECTISRTLRSIPPPLFQLRLAPLPATARVFAETSASGEAGSPRRARGQAHTLLRSTGPYVGKSGDKFTRQMNGGFIPAMTERRQDRKTARPKDGKTETLKKFRNACRKEEAARKNYRLTKINKGQGLFCPHPCIA